MRRLLLLLMALSLFAAACSGEVASTDDEVATDEPAEAPAEPPAEEPADEPTDEPAEEPSAGEFAEVFPTHDDPRGEPFASFQATYERNDPFSSLDDFCVSHPAAENREATDPGITADTIEIHHIRQQLELLENIGFGVSVGDPALMFETLFGVINEQCGGIRGRTIDLGLSEYDPLNPDIETARVATCLQATEDRNSVIVVNTTGFQGSALLCIAEEHDTAILTTQGVSDEYYERGAGRIFTDDEGLEESMALLANTAVAQGWLDGATVGVIGSDTPGQPEAVQFLVDTLEAQGVNVAVYENLGCSGGTTCAQGVDTTVSAMLDAGVDAVFPMLNILSLPGFVTEMVTQGYEPGDVTFFNSKQNGQDGDLVSSKVVAFGGEVAGNLYNGAHIVAAAATGNFHFVDDVPAFNELCIETYAANGGPQYDYFALEGNTPQLMLGTVCSHVRTVARAIWHAGENPTRDDIYEALANLGPLDANNGLPWAFSGGDQTAPLTAQTLNWTFPCEIPDGAYDDANTCVVANFDWFALE